MGRKKKEIRLKEPGRIREKKISGGNISLYLDIYQNGCKRLHEDVLHISKKPLRYELSGFPSICLAEASCIFQSACL